MPEDFLTCLVFLLISAARFSRAQECQTEIDTLLCQNIVNEFTQLTSDTDYEEYIDYGTHFICNNCQLSTYTNLTFPFGSSGSNFKRFDVSYTQIEFVAGHSFTSCYNLEYLYLDNNFIHEIHPDAFCKLIYLEELHLEVNSLKKIEQHWFNKMSSSMVNISYNALEALNNRAFNYSTALKILDLSHNNVSEVQGDCLEGLNHLEDLNLSYNKINHLPNGLFIWTESLLHLDVSNNQLSTLEYGSLSGLKNLEYLNIAQNNFDKFNSGPLLSTSALQTLSIGGNGVIFDPQRTILNVPTIKELCIEDYVITCDQLENVVRFLRSKHVNIRTRNMWFAGLNIDGIPCTKDNDRGYDRTRRWNEFLVEYEADAERLK